MDVGTLLHDAVDDVPVRPLNPAALRSRVRRSRLVLATSVATAAVAATATLALVPRPAPVAAPWPSTCPLSNVLPWGASGTAVRGPADQMVPEGTRRMLICHYGPAGTSPGPRPAQAARLLPSSNVNYSAVVQRINEVEHDNFETHYCPKNSGEQFVVYLEQAHGGTVAVTIEADGCGYISNGTTVARAGAAVRPLLLALLGEL